MSMHIAVRKATITNLLRNRGLRLESEKSISEEQQKLGENTTFSKQCRIFINTSKSPFGTMHLNKLILPICGGTRNRNTQSNLKPFSVKIKQCRFVIDKLQHQSCQNRSFLWKI
jgi:hypothetical protein